MSKKSKKILGATLENKNAKTQKSAATVAKTEKTTDAPKTPKIRMGKYGAPAVRVNRENKNAPSEFGNRKFIFRAGYAVNNGVCTKFSDIRTSECVPTDKTTAEKILAATLAADKNIVNASCRYAGKNANGDTLYLPWFAFASDNGDHRKLA